MDLPTYTNIWRIEKRLYKLYDFRLPMPLPINWIAVFTGITVPYIVLLIAIGLPFNHSLVWLYVLPPGVLTWLTTRPVIESKRLPELIESQARYLTEPRTWVRLVPLSEKDQIVFTARVWRGRQAAQRSGAAPSAATASVAATVKAGLAKEAVAGRGRARAGLPAAALPAAAAAPAAARERDHRPASGRSSRPAVNAHAGGARDGAPGRPLRPRIVALGTGGSGRQAPALPTAYSAPTTSPAATPFPPAAPAVPQAAPSGLQSPRVVPGMIEGTPARARGGGLGAPHPEVSHDRPGRRPAAAAPSAPSSVAPVTNFGITWPASPRPLRPVRSTPDERPAADRQSAPGSPVPPVADFQPETPETPEPPAPEPPAPAARPIIARAVPVTEVPVTEAGPQPQPIPVAADPQPAPVVAEARTPAEAPAPAVADVQAPPLVADPQPAPVIVEEAPAADPAPPPVPVDDRPAPVAVDEPAPAAQAEEPAAQAEEPVEHVAVAEQKTAEQKTAEESADEPASAEEPASADEPVPSAEAPPTPPTIVVPPPPLTRRLGPSTGSAPADRTRLEHSHEPAPAPAAAFAPGPAFTPTPVSAPAFDPSPEPPPVPAGVPVLAPAPPQPQPQPQHPAPAAAPTPVFAAAPPPAPAPAPAVAVNGAQDRAVPSVERALSSPSREQSPSWHGKVKIVTGNGASHGPGARDQEALDRNRARLPISEPRRILLLGCTGGAGQTVTALMAGAMLASLREQPVAAVDLHDGTLARYRAPAAWLDELLAGRPPEPVLQNRPDGLNPTPKPSLSRLDVIASHQPLGDGDEVKLAVQLNRHYPLTMLDPGPSGLTRLLKVTDELVVVVPANAEAAGALADTRDWLDNNGYAELAMRSVTVINGVSRRSLPDVEHAESIARGRSRAIVRVPWDDMLPVAATGPSTLRPQTRVAYTALAGVLVAGLAAVPVRRKA